MTIFKVSDGTNFIYNRTDNYTNEFKTVTDYWHYLDGSLKKGAKEGYYSIRGYSSLRKARAANDGTNPDKLAIFMLSNPITVLQLSKGTDDNE